MEDFVPIDVLKHRLSAVEDAVLQGKLNKALGVLSRCFALYRCVGALLICLTADLRHRMLLYKIQQLRSWGWRLQT